MGFSRQEYWNRLPYPPPGDLPDPGFKPASPALAGSFFTTEPPGRASLVAQMVKNAMWETWVQSLGWEDPLEEGMATLSSILAWRIP